MTEPIPMRIPCPGTVPDGHGGLKICGQLHIDEGEFLTKPHHTHSCQYCGLTWRPAVVHTVGVQFLPGFKNNPLAPKVILLKSTWTHIATGTEVVVEYTDEGTVRLSNGATWDPVHFLANFFWVRDL